jgi:hypothetical protein
MTDTSELGPMPDPQIEPKEPNPGGVDAVDEDDAPPAVHDLDPGDNPAIEDAAPDEISELEDTETAATSGDEPDEVDAKDESPA